MPKGERIYSLEQLDKLIKNRKSIVSDAPSFNQPKPAIILMNMQGRVILKYLKNGIWEYKKENKNARRKTSPIFAKQPETIQALSGQFQALTGSRG